MIHQFTIEKSNNGNSVVAKSGGKRGRSSTGNRNGKSNGKNSKHLGMAVVNRSPRPEEIIPFEDDEASSYGSGSRYFEDFDQGLNCWEVKQCGREPGGSKTSEFGVCPAAEMSIYDGLNGGKNAGRICWAVSGTLCGGKVQGSFAQKSKSCFNCEVFKSVKKDEGRQMVLEPTNSFDDF